MTTAQHASILFRLGRRRAQPVEPDPADLGTAFGLDMSLDVATAPAAPPAPAESAPWWHRYGWLPAR